MSDISVDYIADEYGIYRPTVTIWNVNATTLRTLSVLNIRRNAPAPRETLQRTTGDYEVVAEQYRSFMRYGRPVQDIAALYSVPVPTAAGWVQESRARGLLEPTFKGRGNGTPPQPHSVRKARHKHKHEETANV